MKIRPECVERLVLARLLVKVNKPLSRSKVVGAVVKAIAPPLTPAAAGQAVSEAIEACVRAGQIAPDLQLTEAGRSSIRDALGLAPSASITRWTHAQQLVGLALIGRAGGVTRALDAEQLSARALAAAHAVDTSKSLTKMVDRISWQALGRDSSAPFTIAAVQRYLLREVVPADVRVSNPVWRRMLAMRALGAEGHDANALTRALLCQGEREGNDNAGRVHQSPATLADFARAVREAAASPNVARFHDDRAFIGSIWDHMRGRGAIGEMSLDDFKDKLVSAHRQQLLSMARADLVAAMDPHEVERSEARYQNATFHFVQLGAGGVR